MNAYLFAGYVVIWTVLFLYLVYLQRRQYRLNDQLKSLHESLREPAEPREAKPRRAGARE